MSTPIPSFIGFGRSRRAARLSLITLFLGAAGSGLCFAQPEPTIASSPGRVQMEQRLGDKPVDTSSAKSSATAASSPAASSAAAGQPSEAEMMKMMIELSKLNENHKLLAGLDGSWSYTVKMWMDGDSSGKPEESKGTATRKSMMNGRYFVMDAKGEMQIPGEDGKMKKFDFLGHGIDGYDNTKKKFIAVWMDNMGTGIMNSEGTYDEATKTFTYTGQYDLLPGVTQKIRELLKLTDANHMTMEWFEDRGGREVKTMQIDYTRSK